MKKAVWVPREELLLLDETGSAVKLGIQLGEVLEPAKLARTAPAGSLQARQSTFGFKLSDDDMKQTRRGRVRGVGTVCLGCQRGALLAGLVFETPSYLHFGFVDLGSPREIRAVREAAKSDIIPLQFGDDEGTMHWTSCEMRHAFINVIRALEQMPVPQPSAEHIESIVPVALAAHDGSLFRTLGWTAPAKPVAVHLLTSLSFETYRGGREQRQSTGFLALNRTRSGRHGHVTR